MNIYSPPLKQKKIKQELSNLWDKLDSLTAQAYKLTKEQEEYFNRLGRNINRNDILDNIL